MSTTNVTSLFIQPGTLNVGIGTSQPRAKLEVAGSIVPSSNVVYDLGSATLRWRDLYLSGNSINLGGTTISRDSTTGGIKFIDPATNQPLDSIVKNLTASNLTVLGDYVTLNTITSNTEQMVIQNAGTGPALKVTQTGANSIAEFYDDGNALALKIADGGNVGIGTANPQAKLQVLGDVLAGSFGGILLKDFEGTPGNRNAQIMLVEDDPIRNHGFSLYYNGHNTINANSLGVNTLGILRHNNDPIGIPSMVINRADGNIGIGTTIPLAKLHVDGSVYTSSFILYKNKYLLANLIGDGSSSSSPALSGWHLAQLKNAYTLPLTDGFYWIKSPAMPNALQMYVNFTADGGGYDFYRFTGNTSTSPYVFSDHGARSLGLDVFYPRSQPHWAAIYNFVVNVSGSTISNDIKTAGAVYRDNLTNRNATNDGYTASYTTLIMRDPRYYQGGAMDWKVPDGGKWFLRDSVFGEPNGDYIFNAYLAFYAVSSDGSGVGFNDGNNSTPLGSTMICSTNVKGSSLMFF